MSEIPISRFPVPELSELPDDVRDQILAVQERTGFVPNVFLVLAHRPDEFRAFFSYYDALMSRDGGLSKAERRITSRKVIPIIVNRQPAAIQVGSTATYCQSVGCRSGVPGPSISVSLSAIRCLPIRSAYGK